ncbi:MAG: molecular chaperone TorD family protein [Deltaproteobacteria bacterium]|nr:molecular chaperone TorD family protein [Deltaproteobacteria bacterium]
MSQHESQLRLAVEWRLLGLLFERPHSQWRKEVDTVAAEVRRKGLQRAAHAAIEAREGDYMALLGPGGLLSPREVSYRPFSDPGQLFAELTTTYEAFGFATQHEEAPDHIAVEIGFVSYLFLKEAFARACGNGEAATITASARERFIEEHLAGCAAGLRRRLDALPQCYLSLGAHELCKRVPAAPASERPLFAIDADMGCGGCAESFEP